MPISVYHALTATTPDNTAYEIRPSHFNSAHAVTLNASGSEISGAFSNGAVSFGLETNGRITASHNGLTTAAQSNHSHGNPTLNLTNMSGTTGSNSAGLTLSLSAAAPQTVGFSAPGGSSSFQTLSFANSNGVSFSNSNGSLVASIATNYQSQGAYLTTARGSTDAIGLNSALTANGVSVTANSSGLSLNFPAFLTTAAVSNHSHGNPTLALTNLSGTTASASNGLTISLSAAAGGGGADGYNVLAAGTQTATTAGTVSFVNSNGISFGMSGSTQITASHNGLTTARASTDAIGLNSALTANGVSVTANSSGLSLNFPAFLTTAALSNHSHGNPTLALTNLSGTTASNSAGLTLSLSAAAPGGAASLSVYGQSNTTQSSSGTIAGSSLQFAGAGIVSVGVSNGSVIVSGPDTTSYAAYSVGFSTGGNTAGNTGFGTDRVVFAGGANVTLSGSTNGGSATISIVGGAGGGIGLSAGTQSVASGTVVYSNSNNVSFGFSGSSRITASVGANLYALGNTTQNSSTLLGVEALSLNALGAMTAGFSNGSIQLSAPATSSLVAGANITVSTNGSTISIIGASVAASPVSFSAGTSSAALQSLVLSNSNGMSFGLNGSTITASHNGLTTARASTDAIGLNSALTANGVSVTANSSGLSLNFPAFLTTAAVSNHSHGNPTLALTNLSGTTASASNGLTISLSAGVGGNNALNLLGANTAGNTTATGSTIGLSGVNLTLSGTNASQVVISAPATSSLVGGANITISTGGSTISIIGASVAASPVSISAGTTSSALQSLVFSNSNGFSFGLNGSTITGSHNGVTSGPGVGSYFHNVDYWQGSTTMTMLQSTSHVVPFLLPFPLSADFIRMPLTASLVGASTTAATTGNSQFSYGQTRSHNFVIYSRGTGASSQSLISVTSTQLTDQQSINVSANANSTQFSYTNRATYQSEGGTFGLTYDYSSSAASLNFHTSGMTAITGQKVGAFPFAMSLSPGQYWLAYGISSSTQSQFTGDGTRMFNRFTNYGVSQPNLQFGQVGSNTAASYGHMFGLGSFTTAGGGSTSGLPISAISTTSAHNLMLFTLGRIA